MRRAIVSVAALAIALIGLVPAHAVSSTLVINEVDYDQPSTDGSEFLEIKNVSAAPVALGDHAVQLVNGTGGGAAVYQTITLPSADLAAGGYFVVCGNASTVLNCDLDVTPNENLIQNGAPDAVAIVSGTTIVDAVSYEGNSGAPYTEGSGTGLEDDPAEVDQGISRLPDGTDTDLNNVDLDLSCITPGTENTSAAENCQPAVVARIREIQQATHFSTLDDRPVADVPGIVTVARNNGFWFQDPAPDADVETSEGIFVFTSSAPTVAVGDSVVVDGVADEFTPGGHRRRTCRSPRSRRRRSRSSPPGTSCRWPP